MKRKFFLSSSVLIVLTLVVLLAPASRVRVLGVVHHEMFFRGLPYSYWVDRLAMAASRPSAEQEIRAGGASGVPLLVKMLQEPDPDLRWEAAQLLANIAPAIGTNGDPAARALLATMYDNERDKHLDDELTGPSEATVYASPELESQAKRTAAASQAAEKALIKLGPAAIPALTDGLKAPSRLTRADSARLLGRRGDSAGGAAPALAEALANEQEGAVQWQEAQALDRTGAAPPLLASAAGGVIDHAAPRVREWAAVKLAGLGPALIKPHLPAILRTLEQPLDSGTDLRLNHAIQGIGQDAIPVLVRLATGDNAIARGQASMALQSMGPQTVAALADALNSPSAKVRSRAAHALRGFGATAARAVGALSKLAGDPDPEVVVEIIRTLAAIAPGAAATAEAIIKGANNSDVSVRLEAASALPAMPAKTEGAGEAVARAVKDPDPRVRAAGIAAMGSIEPAADSVPDLVLILADAVRGRGVEPAQLQGTKGDCQIDAIQAVASLGPRALPALPAILDALKDPNGLVATAAMAALPGIDPGGEKSAPFLVGLLQDGSYHWIAISALLSAGSTAPAFSAVADDIRSTDQAAAARAIDWVYRERPHDRDALLFKDVVPALIARLGDAALSQQAGNDLEQLSSSPALVPTLAGSLSDPNAQIARGAACVLEDIALYDAQSAAAPAAAAALREALQNGKATDDPELREILVRAVRRLSSRVRG